MDKYLERLFPAELQPLFEKALQSVTCPEEIRIRLGKPIMLYACGKEYYLNTEGVLTDRRGEGYEIRKGDLQRLLEHFTRYSPYAFESELSQGFLSVPGGHRIGVTGEVVAGEDGRVKTLKNISSINIRIAKCMEGVCEKILPFVYENRHPCSLLIVSPPGCGKTTMLRDFIRCYSQGTAYGEGVNVGVADERMELAGSYMGQMQMTLGDRSDVLSGCKKAEGVLMLIRSMNPSVIAVDEIGRKEEIPALRYAATCGIKLLNTVHGTDMQDLLRKEELLGEKWLDMYDRILFLKKEGSCFLIGKLFQRDKEGEFVCVRE